MKLIQILNFASFSYALYFLSLDFIYLFIGDLFDMLLPMLSIYQEYVRNHHYSLQVLTECKSNPNFATVLKRLEGETNYVKIIVFL